MEFVGEVDGDEIQFAVRYDLLEALSGDVPDGDAVETLNRFSDAIGDAALLALARDGAQTEVVVSENDLE